MISLLATAAQMKELDRAAIEERNIPSLTLMERAAQAVADRAAQMIQVSGQEPGEVIVYCGPGNNGGDGIAAARILMERGFKVRAFLVGKREKMTADSCAMEKKLLDAGGKLEDFIVGTAPDQETLSGCSCMIDALFGVGLKRPVAGDFLSAVRQINQEDCPVVACDLPSGVDSDTGVILGEAVRADWTVTFTCLKRGLVQGEGKECAGKAEAVSIGIPEELIFQIIC